MVAGTQIPELGLRSWRGMGTWHVRLWLGVFFPNCAATAADEIFGLRVKDPQNTSPPCQFPPSSRSGEAEPQPTLLVLDAQHSSRPQLFLPVSPDREQQGPIDR